MAIPIRNHLLDIIKQKENWTDKELEKALTKEGTVMTDGKFNKVLLDLEIKGERSFKSSLCLLITLMIFSNSICLCAEIETHFSIINLCSG